MEDHKLFLHPQFLAMDALLAKATAHHCESNPGMKERIPCLMDHELIQELLQSNNAIARETIHVLMYEPHRIQIKEEPVPGSIEVKIGKVYKKQPLIGDKPASEVNFRQPSSWQSWIVWLRLTFLLHNHSIYTTQLILHPQKGLAQLGKIVLPLWHDEQR